MLGRAHADELRHLLRLTGPLLVLQLGQYALGLVDTAIVGRLGAVPLGAVGLGNYAFLTITVFGMGWMFATDPMIAQRVGAGRSEDSGRVLWQGVWVAALGGIPLVVAVAGLASVLDRFGLHPDTVGEMAPYLWARALGLPPALMLIAGRAFLQAHGTTRPLVISVIVANVLNAPLSWLLVFDAGLGAMGAGLASMIANFVQLGVLAFAVLGGGRTRPAAPHGPTIRKILRVGTPIGAHLLLQVGSFAAVGVAVGTFGTRALGGHSVAVTLVSVAFQFVLAIGSATGVRVGHAVGRRRPGDARRVGLLGMGVGAAVMLVAAALFLVVPRALAAVVTTDPIAIEAAVPFLAVAAAFALVDGVQAVAASALRGLGDTAVPLAISLLGHCVIGVPVGLLLGFALGGGATGPWWGFCMGLAVVAVALPYRFVTLTAGTIRMT